LDTWGIADCYTQAIVIKYKTPTSYLLNQLTIMLNSVMVIIEITHVRPFAKPLVSLSLTLFVKNVSILKQER